MMRTVEGIYYVADRYVSGCRDPSGHCPVFRRAWSAAHMHERRQIRTHTHTHKITTTVSEAIGSLAPNARVIALLQR